MPISVAATKVRRRHVEQGRRDIHDEKRDERSEPQHQQEAEGILFEAVGKACGIRQAARLKIVAERGAGRKKQHRCAAGGRKDREAPPQQANRTEIRRMMVRTEAAGKRKRDAPGVDKPRS